MTNHSHTDTVVDTPSSDDDQVDTTASLDVDDDPVFIEGESYTVDDLLNSDLERADRLEHVASKRFAAVVGDEYVTFEVESVSCVDITPLDQLDSIDS